MYNRGKVLKMVDKLVKEGSDESEIYHRIIGTEDFRQIDAKDKEHIRDDVKNQLENHANYNVVQRTMNCKVLMLENERNKIVAYDPVDYTSRMHTHDALTKVMSPNLLGSKLTLAHSEYNPRRYEKVYTNKSGTVIYNKYTPPSWLRGHFFEGSTIEAAVLPPLYHNYFMQLVDNDEASYTYLINWIAYSIRGRNKTMLAAIGIPGIGKGVLASIIAALHGREEGNGVASISGTKFGSNFNDILVGKTFIEFSEVSLVSKEEINNWKQLANETIDVEGKGKDRASTDNHCNFLLTANSMADVRITSDDRRLSLLNLTKIPLTQKLKEFNVANVGELLDQLYRNQDNLDQLARYLWNLEPSNELLSTPFQSKALENLRKASLRDWEKEFISSYCQQHAGQTIKLADAASALDNSLNSRLKLQVRSFEALQTKLAPLLKKYKDKTIFTIRREVQEDGSKPTVLIISKRKEQPEENFLDNFDVVNEHITGD